MNKKLSLFSAILINLNIMLGIGIFINTVELSKRTGAFSACMYLLIATLTFPLILCFSQLLEEIPHGGFYAYGARALSPFVGFINTWCYFTGKLGSAILMIHSSVLLCQQIIPLLATYNTFLIDTVLVVLFVSLNLLNVRTGTSIQMGFLAMKLFPIFFVILSGLYFFSPAHYATHNFIFNGIPSSLPLVLFTMLGFEATVSLSSHITNPSINGPRALYTSFTLTVILIFLFQFFFYGSVGPLLAQVSSFLTAFPQLLTLLAKVAPFTPLAPIKIMINIAIASSALGGAYGIIFSNAWNLYSLAQKKLVLGWHYFVIPNRFQIPFFCVIAEGCLCLIFLFVTKGHQIPLQQMAALGVTLTYMLSILSLLVMKLKKRGQSFVIPLSGFISCMFLLSFCIKYLYTTGFTSLLLFAAIACIGAGVYVVCQRLQKGELNGEFL